MTINPAAGAIRAAMVTTSAGVACGRSGRSANVIRSLRHGLAPMRPSSTASPKIMENSTRTSWQLLSASLRRSWLLTQPLTAIRWMSPSGVPDQRGRMWLRMWES
jgi:hypothetical protein